MSASYHEGRYSEGIAEDLLLVSDDTARSLFESGDICGGPGQRRPVAGRGEYAQRLRAVIGSSEAEYLRALEWEQQREFPDRYVRKLRRRPRAATSSPKERLIGARQFCDAYSAVAFANSQGAVLNTHITLSWSLLGYETDADASAALQLRVIKHMREWYAHKADALGRPFAWMYVHERSATIGLHTHLLVSIPYEWRGEFKEWLRRRVARLSRLAATVAGGFHVASARADRPLMHQWRLFGYLMKSVDPGATLPEFPGCAATVPIADLVPWAHEGPGEVKCKIRMGIAHELRAAARARAQYRSLLECGVTDVRLLFGDYDYKGWAWAQQEARCAGMHDAVEAELLAMALANESERADAEFRDRHEAWLRMAQTRSEGSRGAEELRTRQWTAVSKLLGARAGAEAGVWQPPVW